MTFDALLRTLPNGLHDAVLRGVHVDYVRGEARIDLDIDVGTPDPHVEQSRRGQLRFTGLQFVIIDPPQSAAMPAPTWGLMIDAGSGVPSGARVPLPAVPPDAFLCWIFVSGWNSFIRIAVCDASVE